MTALKLAPVPETQISIWSSFSYVSPAFLGTTVVGGSSVLSAREAPKEAKEPAKLAADLSPLSDEDARNCEVGYAVMLYSLGRGPQTTMYAGDGSTSGRQFFTDKDVAKVFLSGITRYAQELVAGRVVIALRRRRDGAVFV